MNDNTLTCPNCRSEIEITQFIKDRVANDIRREFEHRNRELSLRAVEKSEVLLAMRGEPVERFSEASRFISQP